MLPLPAGFPTPPPYEPTLAPPTGSVRVRLPVSPPVKTGCTNVQQVLQDFRAGRLATEPSRAVRSFPGGTNEKGEPQ